MKKDYNQFTTSDIPLDASFTPSSTKQTVKKPATTSKINAIGAKAKQTTAKKSTTTKKPATESTTKRVKDVEDLSKLNEESISSHSFRHKRNQVLIAILAVLLALSIAFIIVFATVTKVEHNSFIYIHGDVDATCLINGDELTEFKAPANIRGDCILNLNVDVNIKSTGNYHVKFIINCYAGDVPLNQVVVYEPNTTTNGFTFKADGYYHSRDVITGGQIVSLCQGIALNEHDTAVTDDNFKLEIHIYIERA